MGFQVERLYYTLNEVADRWNLQADDLLHMAVQEKLRLSFWIEPRIISAYKENEDGKNEKVVTFLSGYALIQIYPRHAHDILASNRAEIINATSTDSEIIRMCGGEYLTLRLDIDLSRNRIGQDSSDEFDDLWRDVCGEDGIYISVQEESNSISGRPLAPVIGKKDLLILSQEVMRMEEEHPELAADKGDDLQEPEERSSKPVSSRAERTDLLLIGGLLGLLKEKWKEATGTDISDAQVMDALEEWLPGVFKTRTTQDRFARARRALDSTE